MPTRMVNTNTIQWKACLGKWKQYFSKRAMAPLRMPAIMKIATRGTSKSTVIIRNKME